MDDNLKLLDVQLECAKQSARWQDNLNEINEYRDFLMEQVLVVSPETGREFKKGL